APNSRLVLPAAEDRGLMTVIRQNLGKIFFDIGSRPERSFEVDAPFLVVLVKGTQFTVTSDYRSDSVEVKEGTVEVRATADGAGPGTLVTAGHTASIGAGGTTARVSPNAAANDDPPSRGTGDGERPNLSRPQSEQPGTGGGKGENGG